MALTIDPDRLLADLRALRGFGAEGTGVVRLSLSAVDLNARAWLRDRMVDAGLDASIDGVGNVIGRSPAAGPALLIGSHSDTQPTGGWLDGALGVIYGLEIARACAESGEPTLAVDAVAWIDEEGTFGSCLGSRSFCRLTTPEEIAAARDRDGRSLVDAWKSAGLDGVAAVPEPGRYLGYLEAHIEQGANLERDGNQLGVVTTIVGSRNYTIRFAGQQNHAGTTPMHLRRDAGRALIQLASEVDRVFADLAGPATVWTIGRIDLQPGAASVIPGQAEMHLQFRDPELARLETLEAAMNDVVEGADRDGPVDVAAESAISPVDPVRMDDRLQAHLAAAAEHVAGDRWVSMPSAAVHDAMFVETIMPAAMLFVPSIGGISHDFAENTSDDDIVRGCQALALAASSILRDPEVG
jgi:N-carbamoyl-L-amino-acid hydrolase